MKQKQAKMTLLLLPPPSFYFACQVTSYFCQVTSNLRLPVFSVMNIDFMGFNKPVNNGKSTIDFINAIPEMKDVALLQKTVGTL